MKEKDDHGWSYKHSKIISVHENVPQISFIINKLCYTMNGGMYQDPLISIFHIILSPNFHFTQMATPNFHIPHFKGKISIS